MSTYTGNGETQATQDTKAAGNIVGVEGKNTAEGWPEDDTVSGQNNTVSVEATVDKYDPYYRVSV